MRMIHTNSSYHSPISVYNTPPSHGHQQPLQHQTPTHSFSQHTPLHHSPLPATSSPYSSLTITPTPISPFPHAAHLPPSSSSQRRMITIQRRHPSTHTQEPLQPLQQQPHPQPLHYPPPHMHASFAAHDQSFQIQPRGFHALSVAHKSKSATSVSVSESRQSLTSVYTSATEQTAHTMHTAQTTPPQQRGSTDDAATADAVPSPCDGDPFWDYYRTIGDMSRASSTELLQVMRSISADHIVKCFLQKWLQLRMAPTQLPFANDAILSKMGYTRRTRVKHHRTRSTSKRQSFTMSEGGQYTFDRMQQQQQQLEEVSDEDDDDEDVSEDDDFSVASHSARHIHDRHRLTQIQRLSSRSRKPKQSFSRSTASRPFHIESINSSVATTDSTPWAPAAAAPPSSLAPKDSVVYSVIDEERDETVNALMTKFIQQSLRVHDSRARHPRFFAIPSLVRLARQLTERAIEFIRADHNQSHFRQRRHRNVLQALRHFNEDGMNVIGSTILSFCEQRSFVSASRVSRAWFYCSRMPTSRSHVVLRLWNVLQCLVAPQDLWHAVTRTSELIWVDGASHSDSDSDILLSFLARTQREPHERLPTPQSSFSFLDFFASRTQHCRLFSCLTVLQIDLTILSTNVCILYVSLYDAYWDMVSTLCRVESLQSIDLIIIDPHLLLLSYMLNNVHKLSVDKTELKFPSIGVPKNKFLVFSRVITSLSFTCKSLSTAKLVHILDTHFAHFYHRQSTDAHMSETALRAHVRRQCTAIQFKTLESYQLCRKTIQKPLMFDITHALSCLNRRSSLQPVNAVQTLIMRDVRCSEQELQLFLANNSRTLQQFEISFSEFCIFPVLPHRARTIATHSQLSHSHSQSRRGAHAVGDASVNSHGSGGSSSKHSSNANEEETGFPDVSRIARGHKLTRNKSSTQLRIIANLNEIFSAVQNYIQKTTLRLYEHNHRIRKQFQALKKRKRSKANVSSNGVQDIHVTSSPASSNAADYNNIDQQFSNALRTLPLHSLSVSFPTNCEDDYVTGFFEVLKCFENPCDELRLCRLSLNGSCINPPNLRKLNWIRILQSQHIETLCLGRMLYTESFFENVCKLCSHSLLRLELALSFSVEDSRNTPTSSSNSLHATYYLHPRPIQRLFALLSKCRRLAHVSLEFRQTQCLNSCYLQQHSPSMGDKCSSSDTWNAQQQQQQCVFGTPLPQLPGHDLESTPHQEKTPQSADSSTSQSQSACNSTPTFGASGKQREKQDHLLEPIVDIWWIHQFITHKNVRKNLQTFSVCFNELSTKRFEARHDSVTKYTRWKQPHGAGSILRISPQFKQSVEQLMMSWFGDCSELTQIRMVRKLSTMNRFDIIHDMQNREHVPDDKFIADNNKSNDDAVFSFDSISQFKHGGPLSENGAETSETHDIVTYVIRKWRTKYDTYGGDVIGELDQLLMPEIPIA